MKKNFIFGFFSGSIISYMQVSYVWNKKIDEYRKSIEDLLIDD